MEVPRRMVRACDCHGEAMGWRKDPRYRAGGYWVCHVKERARYQDRYDSDPVYRIQKGLLGNRRKRAATLQRMRRATVG